MTYEIVPCCSVKNIVRKLISSHDRNSQPRENPTRITSGEDDQSYPGFQCLRSRAKAYFLSAAAKYVG